jgi:hypothetical protein
VQTDVRELGASRQERRARRKGPGEKGQGGGDRKKSRVQAADSKEKIGNKRSETVDEVAEKR